ncbi:MAG: NAD(P)H-hydrate dehydratase [Candidatus Neomarinimicrobiota bacterium]
MKQVVTARSAQIIDHDAIVKKGLNGTDLMHTAGKAVAKAAAKACKKHSLKQIRIFCGGGNNGGDGYVAALELAKAGFKNIYLISFAPPEMIKGDAKHFFDQIDPEKISVDFIREIDDLETLKLSEDPASCWIDAIFGTGLDRPIEGKFKDYLQYLKDLQKDQYLIAVDIPSGISGTSGKLLGPALKAHETLTMGFYKSGNFLQEAKAYCGKVSLVKLDYPQESLELADPKISLCDHDLIKEKLHPLKITGHKFSAGQVLCIGGSAAMPGAVTLASLAALRGGAGMLRAYVPGKVKDILLKHLVEAIVTEGKDPKILTLADLDKIVALQEKSKAMVLGPGLGRMPASGELVRALIAQASIPLVLDADGLYFADKGILKKNKAGLILTPHTGEFARLMNISLDKISEDPIARALELALETGSIVHLKGSTSLTALPSGRVFIHPTGAPGMATAGSGDLLAGLIASFTAQGHKAEDAVLIAAYYHGTAGQAAAEQLGNRTMIATDILENIPEILKKDEVFK